MILRRYRERSELMPADSADQTIYYDPARILQGLSEKARVNANLLRWSDDILQPYGGIKGVCLDKPQLDNYQSLCTHRGTPMISTH